MAYTQRNYVGDDQLPRAQRGEKQSGWGRLDASIMHSGLSPLAKIACVKLDQVQGVYERLDGTNPLPYPSVSKLARALQVDRRTMEAAVTELESSGLVYVVRKAGAGWKVWLRHQPHHGLFNPGVTLPEKPIPNRPHRPMAEDVKSRFSGQKVPSRAGAEPSDGCTPNAQVPLPNVCRSDSGGSTQNAQPPRSIRSDIGSRKNSGWLESIPSEQVRRCPDCGFLQEAMAALRPVGLSDDKVEFCNCPFWVSTLAMKVRLV